MGVDAVGVGVGARLSGGVSVGITRGPMGTGPSKSTGPCTLGVLVSTGAGGNWKSRADPDCADTGAATPAVQQNAKKRDKNRVVMFTSGSKTYCPSEAALNSV